MSRRTNWRPLIGVLLGVGVGVVLAAGTGQPGVAVGVGAGLSIIFGGGALLMDRPKSE